MPPSAPGLMPPVAANQYARCLIMAKFPSSRPSRDPQPSKRESTNSQHRSASSSHASRKREDNPSKSSSAHRPAGRGTVRMDPMNPPMEV